MTKRDPTTRARQPGERRASWPARPTKRDYEDAMVEIDERLGELIAKIPMLVDELGGLRATAHTLAEHGRKAGEESGKRPRARAVKRKAVAVELILKAAQNPKLSHGSIANAVIGKTGGKEFSRP